MSPIEELAAFARAHLKQALGGPKVEPPRGGIFDKLAATFVTLRWKDDRLQGCIGSIEPRRPLAEDVAHNVVAAALVDPRAAPITLVDVDDLLVEVSILSPLEEVAFKDEASAMEGIREAGVVLEWRGRRATFLPVMWERLDGPREFLRQLKLKAGLPSDFWSEQIHLFRYTVEHHTDVAS
jgi:hypothetical protein